LFFERVAGRGIAEVKGGSVGGKCAIRSSSRKPADNSRFELGRNSSQFEHVDFQRHSAIAKSSLAVDRSALVCTTASLIRTMLKIVATSDFKEN